MIDIPLILFILICEGFFVLLVVLLLWLYKFFKNNKTNRKAVNQLVKQVKHQSKTRLEKTGSFLNEKYHFEGNELKKAVKLLDKSEKKFYQVIIRMYLKRDAKSLASIDSSVAELIDTYKSLSPVIPDTESLMSELVTDIEQLREANSDLTEKLKVSEATINDMVGEFGNMFGGGEVNDLGAEDISEKLTSKNPPSSQKIS